MSINNKKSGETAENFFDDDFEVTYQEDDYSKLLRREFENKADDRYSDNYTDYDDHYDFDSSYGNDFDYDDNYDRHDDFDYDDYDRYDDYYDDYDFVYDDYDDDYDRYDDYYDRHDNYDYDRRDDYYDDYGYNDYDRQDSYRKKRLSAPNLVSPAAKTAKTSVTIVYRLVNLLLHSATLILIAVITYTLAINFWKNHSTYGNIIYAFTEKNFILAAYAAVAAFLLLFEFFTFLLVLFASKKNDHRGRRVDTGRGMFSFIFIYAGSYLAFFLNGLVPASPALLLGVQGALIIYGSLRSVLLPLCIAGIISCLARKFVIR